MGHRACKEERAFREPKTVGADLDNFAAADLINLVCDAVCGEVREECADQECDGCVGMVATGHLVNQIGEAGIAHMRQLVKEWKR